MSVFKAYGHLLLEKYTPAIQSLGIEKDVYKNFFDLYQKCRQATAPVQYGPQHNRQEYRLEIPETLQGDIQTLGQRIAAINYEEVLSRATSVTGAPPDVLEPALMILKFYDLYARLDWTYNKREKLKKNEIGGLSTNKPIRYTINNCEIFMPISNETSKQYLKDVNAAQVEASLTKRNPPWCTGTQNGQNMTEYYLQSQRLIYVKYGPNIQDILSIGTDPATGDILYNSGSTVDFYNRSIPNARIISKMTGLSENDITAIGKKSMEIKLSNNKKDKNSMDTYNKELVYEFILKNNYTSKISGLLAIQAGIAADGYDVDMAHDIDAQIDYWSVLGKNIDLYKKDKIFDCLLRLCNWKVDILADSVNYDTGLNFDDTIDNILGVRDSQDVINTLKAVLICNSIYYMYDKKVEYPGYPNMPGNDSLKYNAFMLFIALIILKYKIFAILDVIEYKPLLDGIKTTIANLDHDKALDKLKEMSFMDLANSYNAVK